MVINIGGDAPKHKKRFRLIPPIAYMINYHPTKDWL